MLTDNLIFFKCPIKYCPPKSYQKPETLRSLIKKRLKSKPKRLTQSPIDFERLKWVLKNHKGLGQSPVNIAECNVKKEWFLRLSFFDLFYPTKLTKLENTGETIRVYIGKYAYLCGGPLYGFYKFAQLHFHWSKTNDTGTEHAFEGKRFSMEAHFVFEEDSCFDVYPTILKQRSPFCVLGLLFKAVKNGPRYQIFDYLSHVLEPHTSVTIDGNLLTDFREVLNSDNYYNYSGSLTTPRFDENIEWIVFKKILLIDQSQLNILRKVKGKEGVIPGEIRPLQVMQREIFSPITPEDAEEEDIDCDPPKTICPIDDED